MANEITIPEAYTTTEVAAMLGVSRVTVWRAVRDGKLTVRKHAGRNVIFPSDLLEYVLRYRDGQGIPAS